MPEETIIPKVELPFVPAELIQAVDTTIGGRDVYKLVMLVDADDVDPKAMRALRKARKVELSLEGMQKPLPISSDAPHPRQMTVLDGMGNNPHPAIVPKVYSMQIVEMPKHKDAVTQVVKALKKYGEVKDSKQIRQYLESLPFTFLAKVAEVDAVEIRSAIEAFGAKVALVEWEMPAITLPGEPAIPSFLTAVAPASGKVTLDQLTLGSQWVTKLMGDVIRIHAIDEGGVHAHSLYAKYSPMLPWVFALTVAAATEEQQVASLNDESLASLADEEAIALKLDEETAAKLSEGPVLFPVAEVPLLAVVVVGNAQYTVASGKLDEDEGRTRAVAVLVDESGAEVLAELHEQVELIATPQLSPLVYHAIADAVPAENQAPVAAGLQEAQEGADQTAGSVDAEGGNSDASEGTQAGEDESPEEIPSGLSVLDGGAESEDSEPGDDEVA